MKFIVAVAACGIMSVASLGVSASRAWAQSDAPSLLDFGLPCSDPLQEVTTPKTPTSPQLAPTSNRATPLSAPEYPPTSRRLGEEGTAVMRLLVTESGEVSRAEIHKSTGSSRLDAAALEVTRKWRLNAGTLNGKSRCMWGKFAVSFVLNDYMADELAAVQVRVEAQRLASLLVSGGDIPRLLKSQRPDNQMAQMLDAMFEAVRRRPEWTAAEDRLARILTIEFSPVELAELTELFSRPVAMKWLRLDRKIGPEVEDQQQLLMATLSCSVGQMQGIFERADQGSTFSNGVLTDESRDAIGRQVEAALPYCKCAAERFKKLEKSRAPMSGNILAECGSPPGLAVL